MVDEKSEYNQERGNCEKFSGNTPLFPLNVGVGWSEERKIHGLNETVAYKRSSNGAATVERDHSYALPGSVPPWVPTCL